MPDEHLHDARTSSLWTRLFGRAPEAASAPSATDAGEVRSTLNAVVGDFCDIDLPIDDPDADARLGALSGFTRDLGGGRDPDWAGARDTFRTQRRAERAWVQRTLSDFKQAMVDVAKRLGRSIERDRGGDDRVARTMTVLRALATDPATDLAALRHSVLHAVDVVESSARERMQRQDRELEALRVAIGGMRVELRQARVQAETDPLTGLANRASLDQHLEGIAALGGVRNVRASILLLDLDRFKRINDTYGHPAEDAVLKAVAARMRRIGTHETDLIARYGGEEIAVVLHDCREADALVLAERIRAAIGELEIPHGGDVLKITASIGVAERQADETPAALLERVDRALYAAKQHGRDQVRAAA